MASKKPKPKRPYPLGYVREHSTTNPATRYVPVPKKRKK